MVKNPPAMRETWIWSLGWKDPLEEKMAPHFSVLVWETLWTEEPGSPWGCKELDTTEATKYTAHMTHLDSSYIPRSTQVYSRNFKCNSNAFIIKSVYFSKS